MKPKKELLTDKEAQKLSPLQAIRQKCLECMMFESAQVRECDITNCPNYQYRFGKNPRRKGIGNKNVSKNSNSTK